MDHSDDDQVAALFHQIRCEQGRLDILVNNAFAIPEDLTDPKPFWEKPLSNWDMVDVGVRSNFVAAWHAAQLMVGQKSGLIVAISGACSSEFPGRVIAALAADADLMKRSGGTFITAEVAADYGITDVDGKVIPSLRAQRGAPIWQPIPEASSRPRKSPLDNRHEILRGTGHSKASGNPCTASAAGFGGLPTRGLPRGCPHRIVRLRQSTKRQASRALRWTP